MGEFDRILDDMKAGEPTLSARKKARKLAKELKRQLSDGPQVGYDGKPRPDPQMRGDKEGKTTVVNETSSAIDWLYHKRHLDDPIESKDERDLNAAASAGGRRKTVSEKIETIFHEAQITVLKSADPESFSGGGFGPRSPGLAAMVAQMTIQEMRRLVPDDLMEILERVLIENDFIWHGLERHVREESLEQTRMALDIADWALIHARKNRAEEAMERALAGKDRRVLYLRHKWPYLDEWFRRIALDRAMHLAAVIPDPRRKRQAREPEVPFPAPTRAARTASR